MLSVIVGNTVIFTRVNSVKGWEEMIEYLFSFQYKRDAVKAARLANGWYQMEIAII